jgi:hypothetical protein
MSRRPYGSNPRHAKCIAPKHARGTVNGYSNHGCRCPRCREAWRVYQAARREAVAS